MHTIIVIGGGFLILGISVLLGRYVGGSEPAQMARVALVFIPVWFGLSLLNLWVGVSRAGYSVSEEAPVFLAVFAVPALTAILLWWKWS